MKRQTDREIKTWMDITCFTPVQLEVLSALSISPLKNDQDRKQKRQDPKELISS
uniref:Uncharacterized protein n=1 Tax=Anguilla anguilla TaxID=7936 RepID=A0A0E9RG14_ANGAN